MTAVDLDLFIQRYPNEPREVYYLFLFPAKQYYIGCSASATLLITIDSTEDAINSIFESLEDGKAYFLATYAPGIISAVNTSYGSGYTLGEVRENTRDFLFTDNIKALAESVNPLADVATSGSYDDLSDKPTIPTITTQAHIADTSTGLSASSVSILGIDVPTGASYSALVAAHNDLSSKFNALLDALETNQVLAAS